MGMRPVSLLGNAFDEVAAYFGELLGFGARGGGCGTIEPLLRLSKLSNATIVIRRGADPSPGTIFPPRTMYFPPKG
jgi:hypothetical protein